VRPCTLRSMFSAVFSPIVRLAVASLLLAGVALCPGLARAGGLYRCTGSSGETVFSSGTAGYSDCHKLPGTSAPTPRPARVAAAPIASVLGVHGSVESSARLVDGSVEPSLAQVHGDVETSARAAASVPVLPVGKPGQWAYSDSKKALDDTAAAIAAPGDRVLRGSVYRVVHPDGSVEYTNVAPGGEKGRAVTMLVR